MSALFTKAQREQLLDNGRRQAAIKGTPAELDLYPVVKLFNPCGAATWLLTEIDPEDESVAWGLCDLGMDFPEFVRVNFCSAAVLIALASARGWQNHAAWLAASQLEINKSRQLDRKRSKLPQRRGKAVHLEKITFCTRKGRQAQFCDSTKPCRHLSQS